MGAPNTPLILSTLVTTCQGLQIAGASSNFFAASSVSFGRFKDVTDILPILEITADDDDTARYSLGSAPVIGGKIDDTQLFLLEVTLDMTNGITVETTLAQIRDAITQTFHTSATLGLQGLVAYAGIEKGSGKRGYVMRNGQWRRIYRIKLRVRYEYQVIPQP